MNDKLKESDCCNLPANVPAHLPSFTTGGVNSNKHQRVTGRGTRIVRLGFSFMVIAFVYSCTGCGQDAPPAKPAAEVKPAAPPIPEEVQSAADALLGQETTVLLVGDLAKNGKQQFLAANVVPKTPKNSLPGTIVTRAVMAENDSGKWTEILRCDQHLKNAKGYLGLTPLTSVIGWRLDYEQEPEKGLSLYFTPLKDTGTADTHVLPIGVRWNSKTNRYQSLDRSYEHFLGEAPSLDAAHSTLR